MNESDNSSLSDFLSDLQQNESEFNLNNKEGDDAGAKPPEEGAQAPVRRDNREIRRLRQRLEDSEKLSQELNSRIKELASDRDNRKPDVVDDDLARIYGTESAQHIEAGNILRRNLQKVRDEAVEAAYNRLKQEQEQENEQMSARERQANEEIDTFLDDIEEQFNVDMSSETEEAEENRQGFYKALAKYSRKDSTGSIIEFADPVAVWELYSNRKDSTVNKAQALASRAMTRSGESKTAAETNQSEKWLLEQGII